MSESTTPETLTYYSLQVQRAENVKWKSKFHRWIRRFYIEVQLGDIVQRSERASNLSTSSNPSANQYEWNVTFPLSVQASDTRVSIKLKHISSYKSDPCIGYIEGELTELLHRRESVSLRKGPSESSPVTATLFFKFEVSGAKLNAKTAFRNLQSSLDDRTHPASQSLGADAEQTPDQGSKQEPDDVNGAKFQTIRHVVPNIDKTATAMTEVLDINPELDDAWNLTRDLYSVISERFGTGRVVHLAAKHFTIFEFVRAEDRLHDILDGMQDSVLRIFEAVLRCCLFIREYSRRNPATRRIHRSADTEKMIEIENSLERLETELEDAFNVQMMAILNREPLAHTTALYSLNVEYTHGAPKRLGLFDQTSKFYVEVRLSDVPDRARSRSIEEDASDGLKHTFSLVSSEPSSLLIVELIQERSSTKERYRLGIHRFKLNELLEKCKTSDGGLTFDCSSGHMVLNLEEIDKITCASIKMRNTGKRVEKIGTGRVSKVIGFTGGVCGAISSQGDENGDLYTSAGMLLLKIDAFAKIAGDITAINPYLSLVWGLASAVYKVISHQIRTDGRVVNLLRQLEVKFDFVRDTTSLRNKSFFLKSAIERLLQTSEESCKFIESYFNRSLVERMVTIGDTQEIERHENSLSQLTAMFDGGEKQYKEALDAHSRLKTKLEPNIMNAYSRPSCLADTQVGVRGQISSWLASDSGRPVLWLHGVAGSGKSTIVNTIAQELDKTRQLGAYLFFERAKSKPEKVVHTLAYQLAKSNAVIAKHVEDRTVGNTIEHFSSFKELIIDPLTAADPYVEGPIVIILDALDECGKPTERERLLEALVSNLSKLPSNFRILVTSRPERDLQNALQGHDPVLPVQLKHDTKASRDDVSRYFTYEMGELFKPDDMRLQVPIGWQWDANIERLSEATNGLFIWASTAVKYISSGNNVAFKRLDNLARDVQLAGHMEFGIEELYISILDSIQLDWKDDDSRLRFSQILYLVLTVNTTLSTDDIDAILGLSPQSSSDIILSRLQSVVTYKRESRSRIRLLHASFGDFLTSDKHAKEKWFVDIRSTEEYIHQRCLDSFDIMKRLLRFNICGARSSFKANIDEGQLTYSVDNRIPTSLRDACLSWARQLRIQPCTKVFLENLSRFLHNRLLFWLEVLSLIEEVDEASDILLDVIRWILGSEPSLESFLRESQELISTFESTISERLPHIYLSMLPLARKGSKVTSHYSQFMSPTTEVDITGDTPGTSSGKRLKQARGDYNSVSYSPDGRHIAVGSDKNTVTMWDAESGDVTAGPMRGHTGAVYSVAFSPDGERIVSGSGDKTVRVWDVERTEVILIIKGHTRAVNSVAFSRDGRFIVSGSDDRTVRVWDAKSGKPAFSPMQGHKSAVRSVSFSPDGKCIASGSADKKVRVWDARNGKSVKHPFEGHTGAVNCIAYSPDGKYIVSGSDDKTIIVWEMESQIVIGPLKGHEHGILSVAYSPNGKYIVSGSRDRTSRVWAVNGEEIVSYSVKRHEWSVRRRFISTHIKIGALSVEFSPDSQRVASSVYDDGIEIWDIERGEGDFNSSNGHTDRISSVAFLPDNRRVVSGSEDETLVGWDTKSGKLVLGPLKGHTRLVTCVACSTDGKFILSGSGDGTVRVWNADTGKHVRTLTRVGPWVWCVAVSRDGKLVVAGSDDGTICIWDIESGDLVLILKGHTSAVRSVCFSPDGNLIASGSDDKTLIVWSAQSGTIVAGPFEGHAREISTVVFSPDGKRILSGSQDRTIRVWDTQIGQLAIAPFKGQAAVYSISLSPDGRHVASGSGDGTITVWNLESGDIVQGPLRGLTSSVDSVAYSSDGKYIVSASDDGTIRVWDAENDVAPVLLKGDAHSNWTLSDNGWILGQGGELLLWLPPDLHVGLWQPRNTAIFNSRFLVKLRFKECGIGERWEGGFDQKAFAERKENPSK